MNRRRAIVLLGWAALLVAALGFTYATFRPVVEVAGLYAGRALQTGKLQGADPGSLAKSFADVLVKTSGDVRLVDDPRLASFADGLPNWITNIDYRDRMEGIPIGDEQGTRERPYELTVHFVPAMINEALMTLGAKPWPGPRSRIAVFLGVKNSARSYLLATDSEFGFDQRDSLLASAWQAGLPMLLPGGKALRQAGLDFEKVAAADPAALVSMARAIGGDTALVGTLVWNDGARGWTADWRLATADGQTSRWHLRDVNFDQAFQNAMLGTLSILSGHGLVAAP